MVRSRLPDSLQEFHTIQLVECNAAPVVWRSRHLQTAPACSAILITKYAKLTLLVSSQSVRAEQPQMPVINGGYWPPRLNGLTDHLIVVFQQP